MWPLKSMTIHLQCIFDPKYKVLVLNFLPYVLGILRKVKVLAKKVMQGPSVDFPLLLEVTLMRLPEVIVRSEVREYVQASYLCGT